MLDRLILSDEKQVNGEPHDAFGYSGLGDGDSSGGGFGHGFGGELYT